MLSFYHCVWGGTSVIVERTRSKDSLSDAEWATKKEKWKAVLLSLPCNFTELATPDIWQAASAFNKRQAVLQDHESLGRTALQAACEIAHLKTLVEAQSSARGKLTAASLSSELVKLGFQQVVGGNKDDDGDSETGSLAPTFITWALSVHKHVVSNSRCVELLMDLEARFGSRSPFHRMSKLSVIATTPASVTSREWILASIHDAVCNGQLKAGDVTKTMLQGDRTHVGLVALCECKQRVTWRISVPNGSEKFAETVSAIFSVQ